MKLTQPIKWHGGKRYLAKRIIELMPPHNRYLEAYAGGMSVLLNKPYEGIAEWANDTNSQLMQFWWALGCEPIFKKFARMVEAVPLSEKSFTRACRNIESVAKLFAPERPPFTVDATVQAASFFIKMRMSRQGLGKDYCTPTSRTRRGMNENVSAWLTAVDGLPEIHARLRRVEVWSRPAVEAIRKLDGSDLLVYADPPYMHETRSSKGEYGEHEMTQEQHAELLQCLASIQGKFLLSGYHSDAYDRFAAEQGWQCAEFDLPNHASSSKSKERKTECVWMNY